MFIVIAVCVALYLMIGLFFAGIFVTFIALYEKQQHNEFSRSWFWSILIITVLLWPLVFLKFR